MKRAGLASLFIVPSAYVLHVSRREDKLHLVFDLDQTLVQTAYKKAHDNFNNARLRPADDIWTLDKDICYHVWHRPFVHWTLRFLSGLCHVHLFTAATQDYAEKCISPLPPVFQHKHYRTSTGNGGSHGKDLVLLGIPLDKSILVDDQLRNHHDGQLFYHIPPYVRQTRMDFEMIFLAGWVVLEYFKRDLRF
jgi:TFIIF-interacting CTD phosphatase-like protein